MPETEVVALSVELLDEASVLLASYLHPDGAWGADEQHDCKEKLQRLLNFDGADFFVARSDGGCLGFIALNWGFSTTKGQPFVRVQDLYVLPQFRRLDVASALIHKAMDIAKQHNANRVQLDTDTDNKVARTLYERLGFEWFPDKETYMYFV